MKGITSPFVYVGGPMTSFAFHIEDGNLGSINYNHAGDIKCWYVVPGREGDKLENLIKETTAGLCDLLIRHKIVMVSPSILQDNGIEFARVCMLFTIIYV